MEKESNKKAKITEIHGKNDSAYHESLQWREYMNYTSPEKPKIRKSSKSGGITKTGESSNSLVIFKGDKKLPVITETPTNSSLVIFNGGEKLPEITETNTPQEENSSLVIFNGNKKVKFADDEAESSESIINEAPTTTSQDEITEFTLLDEIKHIHLRLRKTIVSICYKHEETGDFQLNLYASVLWEMIDNISEIILEENYITRKQQLENGSISNEDAEELDEKLNKLVLYFKMVKTSCCILFSYVEDEFFRNALYDLIEKLEKKYPNAYFKLTLYY